jgi:hypothetical protein
LLCCSAVFMVMPPLRAMGQGLWLMPLKPWVHLNGATYPGCVEWEVKVQGYVAMYPRDTRGYIAARLPAANDFGQLQDHSVADNNCRTRRFR